MKEVKTIGLNREAYFSEQWYAKEQANVFSKNWSFSGILQKGFCRRYHPALPDLTAR